MFARYIITVLPAGESLPYPVAADSSMLQLELPGHCVIIETPDATPGSALAIRRDAPDRVTITEGHPIPAATGGLRRCRECPGIFFGTARARAAIRVECQGRLANGRVQAGFSLASALSVISL